MTVEEYKAQTIGLGIARGRLEDGATFDPDIPSTSGTKKLKQKEIISGAGLKVSAEILGLPVEDFSHMNPVKTRHYVYHPTCWKRAKKTKTALDGSGSDSSQDRSAA